MSWFSFSMSDSICRVCLIWAAVLSTPGSARGVSVSFGARNPLSPRLLRSLGPRQSNFLFLVGLQGG